MGLFQNLLETYEKCASISGITRQDADGNTDDKKTLLPIYHMTFKTEICITIDENGGFIEASRDKKEVTVIIPCTEKSSGRSSGVAAHPLLDQLDYIGNITESKTKAYLNELSAWKNNSIELNAIFEYIMQSSIISDLIESDVFKDSEFINAEDKTVEELDKEKIRKIGVRFIIQKNDTAVKVWECEELRHSWINYIDGVTNESSDFDYLNGKSIGKIAAQHPKNINSFTGNAKLISCNDMTNYTFRGRFAEQDDAILIDHASSQKMHQILRWLIANYGYRVDSQVILAWAIDGDTSVPAEPMESTFDFFKDKESIQTQGDLFEDVNTQVYASYSEKLKSYLTGFGNAEKLKDHSRRICVAAFDAATTGRMGVVFYTELAQQEYLEKIVNWHTDTSYFLTAWKKEKDEKGKDKSVLVRYFGAPSYDDILFAVYGKARGDKSYDTIKKKTRKQLLECMFGSFTFPASMLNMAANRASKPFSFTDSDNKFNENDWKRAMSITCALARKYYKEQKEEIQLELDEKRQDRDYLFGRLLSVADKLENTALYNADKQNTRTTNAVKLMSAFQVKPYTTWGLLYNQLIPYKNQLMGAYYYQNIIDDILVSFKENEFQENTPLSPLYLLGYSAQNRAFYKNNKNLED